MSEPIRIAVHGAAGRMGQRLIALASADDELKIAAALESPGHPKLGEDAGTLARLRPIGVPLSAKLSEPVDVIVDFSVPTGAMAILKTCLEKAIPLVLATTGLDEQQEAAVADAAKKIAVLSSPSMSLTVNLAMRLSEIAGRAL